MRTKLSMRAVTCFASLLIGLVLAFGTATDARAEVYTVSSDVVEAPSETPAEKSCRVLVQKAQPQNESEVISRAFEIRRIQLFRNPLAAQISRESSPLSDEEMGKVMAWIAARVASERLSFCYRQSRGRGAGVPLTSNCPEGTEKNGQLCYPKCDEGYKGNGPVCWSECPDGFNDIGAFCQKPAPKGRGFGYVMGDKGKCERENSQGCELNGLLYYPRCQEGYRAFGANICTPVCPQGLADTGTGCTKRNYPRTAGETLACPEGTEKNGLLCYKPCADGFKGVGPVCWAGCPSQNPIECGAGCTTTKEACVEDVKEKVVSVVESAISLATLGSGSGKIVSKFSEITDAIENVKNTVEAVATIQDLIEQATSEFSGDFATMTTDEINEQIDNTFSAEAAVYIKKEWAKRHLRMTWPSSTIAAAKKIGSLASIADPTGISSVVNAFSNPICEDDTPFPSVSPRY